MKELFPLFLACLVSVNVGCSPADTKTLDDLVLTQKKIIEGQANIKEINGFFNQSESTNLVIRINVLGMLGQIAFEKKEYLPNVVSIYKNKLITGDDFEKRAVTEQMISLATLGEPVASMIPLLVDQLNAGDIDYAWFAVEALGNFYGIARPAIPALIEAIRIPEKGQAPNLLTEYAIDALGKIGGDEALNTLAELTRNKNEMVSQCAQKALKNLKGDDHQP